MGLLSKKSKVWKIYNAEYGPFLATDWLKQKKLCGPWANLDLYDSYVSKFQFVNYFFANLVGLSLSTSSKKVYV